MDHRAFWILLANVALLLGLVVTLCCLLEIYAPSLLLPLAGLSGGGLAVAWGVASGLLSSKALAATFDELWKRVSKVLQQRRVALGLVVVTAIAVPLTIWDRQVNTDCPILQIEPAGVFEYFLADGENTDKPAQRTFEIVVSWENERRSFYPPDDGVIEIGARKAVLLWRASREKKGKDQQDKPETHYLGTSRFHTGVKIRVGVLCQSSREELFFVEKPIEPDPKPWELGPKDDIDFAQKVEKCEPKAS